MESLYEDGWEVGRSWNLHPHEWMDAASWERVRSCGTKLVHFTRVL